jgi:hypothetical protein
MGGGRALKADVLFLDDRCPGGLLGLDPGQDQHLSGGSNSKDALDQVQAVGGHAAQGLPVILAPLAAIGALASLVCRGDEVASMGVALVAAEPTLVANPPDRGVWKEAISRQVAKHAKHAKKSAILR